MPPEFCGRGPDKETRELNLTKKENLMRHVALTAAFILLAATASTVAWAEGEKATFTLAPPDGIEFKSTLTETTTIVVKDIVDEAGVTSDVTRVDEKKITTKNRVAKAGDDWELTEVALAVSATRDGAAMDNSLNEMMVGREFTAVVSADGEIKEIRGFDTFINDFKETMPPEAAAVIATLLDPQVLMDAAATEWNNRVGNFVGATVETDDIWLDEEDFSLPSGGTVKFYTLTYIAKIEYVDGDPRVLIGFEYTSDATALGPFTEDILKKLPKGGPSGVEVVELSGDGFRIVDASTMLILEEESSRIIKMSMEFPGQEGMKDMTSTEKKVYTYEY